MFNNQQHPINGKKTIPINFMYFILEQYYKRREEINFFIYKHLFLKRFDKAMKIIMKNDHELGELKANE